MSPRGCLARAAPGRTRLARVFTGPNGVRAGWRLALFLLAFTVQIILVVIALRWVVRAWAIHALGPGGQITPGLGLLNETGLLLPVLGATWLMAWLEGRSLFAYGLQGAHKARFFTIGLAAGVALLALLIFVLRATGYGIASPGALSPSGALRFGLEWLAVSLLIGLTEELAFRGYLLATLAGGIGFWPAALLTSLLFGAIHGHNPGETYTGLILAGLFGLLCCLAIRRTLSLWFAIGIHGGWDYAENFLFGTRDSGNPCFGALQRLAPHGNILLSGGPTGPEGSLFCLLILLLAFAGLWIALPSRSRP